MEKTSYIFYFEDLRLFQKNIELIEVVFKVAATFPESEKDNFTTKFKVSAQNIAINIAEGSGEHKTVYLDSVRTGRIAVKECFAYAFIARKLNFIDDATLDDLRERLTEISKMIGGLIRSLKGYSNSNYRQRDGEGIVENDKVIEYNHGNSIDDNENNGNVIDNIESSFNYEKFKFNDSSESI